MNFVDRTLVRLADAATRTALFDATSLEQLLRAAYRTETATVNAPYSAVFDDLTFGVALPPTATVEGTWSDPLAVTSNSIQLRLTGLSERAGPRVDAVWKGAIIGRTTAQDSTINAVTVRLPDLDIDAAIVADLGALPADPVALETERRTRMRNAVRAVMQQPDLMDDQAFDALLASLGVQTASEYVVSASRINRPMGVRVSFTPADGPSLPQPFPLMAALLVRETVSVATLLNEAKEVRQRLAGAGLEPARPGPVSRRQPFVVAVMAPATVFDDPDWPGATGGQTPDQSRRARRVRAGRWLAEEGIGLVGVPT